MNFPHRKYFDKNNIHKNKILETVYSLHSYCNRSELSWRNNITPYRILISELMLQQTQVTRVEKYFIKWLQLFPDIKILADASNKEVLSAWSGLGYNSRALRLQKAAQIIVNKHKTIIPDNYHQLIELPGIGEYTASAIISFAFNKISCMLETNIKTFLLYFFYDDNEKEIDDKELKKILSLICDHEKPREWYYALMDIGAALKQEQGNLNKISKDYKKQSRFNGSVRQVRAGIVRELLSNNNIEQKYFENKYDITLLEKALNGLLKENIITIKENSYYIL